ncbi:MAG TPA: ATP-grasp domain-containing protein [Gemmatimonadales bacterium]|nr:ATP-grasp domain-containing protein [Gemmatimonadales bacterium]
MNVFAFEFVSGGGLAGEPLPPSLARAGDMMLRALVHDLMRVPGVQALASRDPRLPPLEGIRAIVPEPGEGALALYARGARSADAAWPTAPETGGALERLARETLGLGKVLLGSSPDAVRLTTSKHATALALSEAGIPAVPTFGRADRLPPLPGPWVVKPDDGAGCDGAELVPDWGAARERLTGGPPRLVAQPWLDGCALSLSLLCSEGRARLLSCNRQLIRVAHARPALAAVRVNAVPDRDGRFAELATRIAAAIPGLRAYVGVDLVVTEQGPVVLEINPRLTTSYCGLRRALGVNVAALVLDLVRGGRIEGRRWPAGRHVTVSTEPGHGV